MVRCPTGPLSYWSIVLLVHRPTWQSTWSSPWFCWSTVLLTPSGGGVRGLRAVASAGVGQYADDVHAARAETGQCVAEGRRTQRHLRRKRVDLAEVFQLETCGQSNGFVR